MHTDVLIIGGGVGGCAAAMAVTSLGLRAVLTEETAWLGGQLTSQAVPPDEHPWIEKFGCTARYRAFREGVRQWYRDHRPLTDAAKADPHLNPGLGRVSRLCHEPKVAVAVIERMLAEAQSRGLLKVMLRTRPVGVEVDRDRVHAVVVEDLDDGGRRIIAAPYVLDATETGDLLPMAGVEYVRGAESRAQTGEPHAAEKPNPDNEQAITWCFPMSFDDAPGANHTIDKPEQYGFWRDYVPQLTPPWPGKLLAIDDTHPITLQPRRLELLSKNVNKPGEIGPGTWWLYRRILAAEHHRPDEQGKLPHDVTLVNWPRNDYFLGGIIDQPPEVVAKHLRGAKQLSLSLFYWLQTECPRPDGGVGYPGLYLRPDIAGTDDGLAKMPYIRESRRIKAVFTVLEQHVGLEARGGYDIHGIKPRPAIVNENVKAEPFFDSVGVGSYRIDLHMSTGGDNYIDIASLPFQIPLGALLPVRMTNLLPACKNLGVTHITNGCYRLHPVEWNIGEAAGLLAAFALQRKTTPHAVRETPELLAEFQRLLDQQGVERAWPDPIA